MKRKKFKIAGDCIQPEFDFSIDRDADGKTRKIIENIFTPEELPVSSTDKGYRNY